MLFLYKGKVKNMAEPTVADNIKNTVRGLFNPSPGDDAYNGALHKKKIEFLKQYAEKLNGDPAYAGNEEAFTKKLEQVSNEFDKKVSESAATGAAKGSDPTAFKTTDPEEQKTKGTITGMISGAFDALMGWITGGASWMWNLIKPMFGGLFDKLGDNIADQRSDETKTKQSRAAGIASALGAPVDIAGMEFSLTREEQAWMYRKFSDTDFSKPAPANDNKNNLRQIEVPSDVRVDGVSGGTNATSEDHKTAPPVSTETADPERVATRQEDQKAL